MEVQFLSDKKGKVKAVQVAIKDWEELLRKAQAFDVANNIRQGLKEVEMIENGLLPTKSLNELLDEL